MDNKKFIENSTEKFKKETTLILSSNRSEEEKFNEISIDFALTMLSIIKEKGMQDLREMADIYEKVALNYFKSEFGNSAMVRVIEANLND